MSIHKATIIDLETCQGKGGSVIEIGIFQSSS